MTRDEKMTKPLAPAARLAGRVPFLNSHDALFPTRSKRSLIQWPSEREIRGVSEQLARIQRVGVRSEASGDYFKSGDLAYQVQEVIRTTADSASKSARDKA